MGCYLVEALLLYSVVAVMIVDFVIVGAVQGKKWSRKKAGRIRKLLLGNHLYAVLSNIDAD